MLRLSSSVVCVFALFFSLFLSVCPLRHSFSCYQFECIQSKTISRTISFRKPQRMRCLHAKGEISSDRLILLRQLTFYSNISPIGQRILFAKNGIHLNLFSSKRMECIQNKLLFANKYCSNIRERLSVIDMSQKFCIILNWQNCWIDGSTLPDYILFWTKKSFFPPFRILSQR